MNEIPIYLEQFNYDKPSTGSCSSNHKNLLNDNYYKRNINRLANDLTNSGISGNDTSFLLDNYPNYFNEVNQLLQINNEIDTPKIMFSKKNKSTSTIYLIPRSQIEYETDDSDGAVLEFELENPDYDLATDDNVIMQANSNDITQSENKINLDEECYFGLNYDANEESSSAIIDLDDEANKFGNSDYNESLSLSRSSKIKGKDEIILTNLPYKWVTANEVTFEAIANSRKANSGLSRDILRITNGRIPNSEHKGIDDGNNESGDHGDEVSDEDEDMESGSVESADIDPKALLAFISNVSIPENCPIFYYEVKINTDITNYNFSLGLMKHHESIWSLPGLQESSFGYNGKTGSFKIGNSEIEALECFGKGDTVGCGMSPVNNQIFFTKNGEFLRSYYIQKSTFHPVIGFINGSETEINNLNKYGRGSPLNNSYVPSASPVIHEIVTNFGRRPFLFNINDYSARLINNRYTAIFKDNYLLEKRNFNNFGKSKKDNDDAIIDDEEIDIETEKFVDYTIDRPDIFMNDTQMKESINSLIKDYLAHYGYGNTLKSLLSELLTNNKKEQIKENEMNEKKSIRELILSNEFDDLLKMINDKRIKVQKNKRNIRFDLQCLKLIYMIQYFLVNEKSDTDGSQVETLVRNINETNEEFGGDPKKKFIMMSFIKFITDKHFNSNWLTCSSESLEHRTIANTKFYNEDELKIMRYIKPTSFEDLKLKIMDSIFLNYEGNKRREVSKIEKLINLTNSTLKQPCFEPYEHLNVNHFLI